MKLDAFEPDMKGHEFNYDVPPPFGPKRGKAKLSITARPAGGQNASFTSALSDFLFEAKVRDKMREGLEKEDAKKYFDAQRADLQWVEDTNWEMLYQHCIVGWKTTIQSEGRDLEPTRENFLELAKFRHPVVQDIFDKFKKDVSDLTKFASAAEQEAAEEELKN